MSSAVQKLLGLSAMFLVSNCQIHYVPAQILIPTLNVSNPYGYYNYNQIGQPPNRTAPIGWTNPNQVANYPYNPYNFTNQTQGQCKKTDGHLTCGNISPVDRLLFNQEFTKERRWWTSREKLVEYPKDVPGGYVRHETISSIRVTNMFLDGHDSSTAELEGGGVGRKFARIKLQSKWGKGFKYLVQIHGH